jgi:hypothetical protein
MKTKEAESVWKDLDVKCGERAVQDGKFQVEGKSEGEDNAEARGTQR